MATLTTLATFTGTDGEESMGTLLLDAAGNLIGTTSAGGRSGDGTVFEIAKTSGGYASVPTTLAGFSLSNGANPFGGLIADAAGDLFGTTVDGGTSSQTSDGTVFEIAKTQTGYAGLTTLETFLPGGGIAPSAGLILDAAGDLLGTTKIGGFGGNGNVFMLAKAGGGYASTAITLASFSITNGRYPASGLISDAAGDLFGTTGAGGASGDGTVFEIPKTNSGYAGTPVAIVSFNGADGSTPYAGLVADAAGDLFGTTYSGGPNAFGYGSVFEIVKTSTGYASTPTTLVFFNSTDGFGPRAGLIIDAAGNLFGTTTGGGANDYGTVFEIPKVNGAYANAPITLAAFNGTNGGSPWAGLTADAAGDIFGTTYDGGANGDGTVFELTNAGFQVTSASTIPPAVTGTVAGQAVTDQTTLRLFANVTIADTNAGQTETVTVTLSTPANGALSNLSGGSYNTDTGVYTDTGSAASVSSALEGLVFVPTAYQAQSGQTVTTGFTILDTDTAAASAIDSTTSVITTETSPPGTGLLAGLNAAQQLELIYIAYFNRAADGGGYAYWEGQNVQAQNGGQNAATAVTGIANAFAPQPETIALYPFLGASNGDLNTASGEAGLSNFIDSVYGNLFDRAADAAGAAYWVGQIASGAVGLGAAALAIANGATGTDAIQVQNKIAVALNFTVGTTAAGMGGTSTLPASFLGAAKSVLSGVDGTSLYDASVTAAMNATTAFIAGSATGQMIAVTTGAESLPLASANGPLVIATSNSVIYPGAGSHTIQFLAGTSADTLVLHTDGVDQVSGFDPATDVLDLSALLREANVNLNGDIAALGQYRVVTDQSGDALLTFDPAGQGGGSTVAVLRGLGDSVTGLDTLIAHDAVRIT